MCIFFFPKEKATSKLVKSFQIKCIETWCLWKIHLTFCKETKRWLKVSKSQPSIIAIAVHKEGLSLCALTFFIHVLASCMLSRLIK